MSLPWNTTTANLKCVKRNCRHSSKQLYRKITTTYNFINPIGQRAQVINHNCWSSTENVTRIKSLSKFIIRWLLLWCGSHGMMVMMPCRHVTCCMLHVMALWQSTAVHLMQPDKGQLMVCNGTQPFSPVMMCTHTSHIPHLNYLISFKDIISASKKKGQHLKRL